MLSKLLGRYTWQFGKYTIINSEKDLFLRIVELNPKATLEKILPICKEE